MNSCPSAARVRTPRARPASRQGGLATLVVVMLLLFVVGMVAAYTGRTVLFEQRTTTNQVRSTQAFEAADAGLQWAVGMLNGSKIDTGACTASGAGTTFRERYLSVNLTDGVITPKVIAAGGAALTPSCVFNGNTWACSCPDNGPPSITAPTTDEVMPAFRIRFLATGRPGTVTIEVNGCTRYLESCLAFPSQAVSNEGRVTVAAVLALRGGLGTAPMAALTARGQVGAPMTLVNNLETSSGVTVHAGGTVAVGAPGALYSRPGTPASKSVAERDPALLVLDAELMFINSFAMMPSAYAVQPAAIDLTCPGACGTVALQSLAANNPRRVFWLNGNATIDGSLGTPDEPVLLVVNGQLTLGPAANIVGLVYVRTAAWDTTASSGSVRGAMVAEGAVLGSGTTQVVYDSTVLNSMRLQHGSMVIVPGSWKDF